MAVKGLLVLDLPLSRFTDFVLVKDSGVSVMSLS